MVNAVTLIYYTRSYPDRTEFQEYAMENYFSYRNPDGKPADSIAGIAIHLGTLYNRDRQYDKSLDLLRRVLKEREPEINDHQLELLHLAYPETLRGQDRDAEAITLLKTAVEKYHGSWEKRLKETIARYPGAPSAASSEPPGR